MPSKKQRRRREKELRHEYEYVYIDEEGKEVEVEPAQSPRASKERRPAASSNGRRPAQVRPVQPPNWKYLRKQAVIFFFIILVAFTVLNRSKPIYYALGMAVVYTAIMLPLMWMTQRMIYRSYLRRTGQLPPPSKRGSK
jgi:Flp pilus assembly protein TadB